MKANKTAIVNFDCLTESVDERLVFMLVHQQVGVFAPRLFATVVSLHITDCIALSANARGVLVASDDGHQIEIQGHANFFVALREVKTIDNAHCCYLISFCVVCFRWH